MRIRKIRREDRPRVRKLAEKYGLDYGGMEDDVFWAAEEEGSVVGICGLKKHSDCLELCSLGVDEAQRGRGFGRELVRALLREVREDVYLATIIPGFFERAGFSGVKEFPSSMNKGDDWCEGCDRSLCTVMVRRKDDDPGVS